MATEPSEGARRAAKKITSMIFGNLQPGVTDELAEIIDRETHSAEMRKALDGLDVDICWQAANYLWSAGGGPMVDRLRALGAALAALKGGAL